MIDIYSMFQQFRVSEIEKDAADANYQAVGNSVDIRSLQDQVDHLSLVCLAMCELMEEIGFNKSMLEAKIREIDLRDGRLDGKFVQKRTCSSCSRDIAARHVKCLYCGTKVGSK